MLRFLYNVLDNFLDHFMDRFFCLFVRSFLLIFLDRFLVSISTEFLNMQNCGFFGVSFLASRCWNPFWDGFWQVLFEVSFLVSVGGGTYNYFQFLITILGVPVDDSLKGLPCIKKPCGKNKKTSWCVLSIILKRSPFLHSENHTTYGET